MKASTEYEKIVEERINAALAQTVVDWEGTTADSRHIAPERELIKLAVDSAGLPLVALDIIPAANGALIGIAFVAVDEDEIERVFFMQ